MKKSKDALRLQGALLKSTKAVRKTFQKEVSEFELLLAKKKRRLEKIERQENDGLHCATRRNAQCRGRTSRRLCLEGATEVGPRRAGASSGQCREAAAGQ